MRINPEGRENVKQNTFVFAIIIAVVTATALVYNWPWWVVMPVELFLVWRIIFVIRFFRDPVRPLLQEEGAVFSPADGKIVVIEEVDEPKVMGGRCIQLSVYMNFYNVHVNWYPVGGEITYKEHYNGAFLFASNPKSSTENEHTTIGVRTKTGTTIMFRQIAGWVARRIVSYPEVGDQVEQNHKAGFIKFGSRVDVFIPLGSEICVGIGDKVVGSQTVLAKLPTANH